MRNFKAEIMQLNMGHGWRAQPNHKILVLDRGALRLDYPETWVVKYEDDCVKIFDKEPPDDECVLGVSYHRWPTAGQGLSVAELVRSSLERDERSYIAVDPIVEVDRMDFVLAWGQGRFIDSRTNLEACARLCLARKDEIQALVTFDFWRSDLESCDEYWRSFLSSMRLCQWIGDPKSGPRLS